MGTFLIKEEAAREHPVDVPKARETRTHSSRSRMGGSEQVAGILIGYEQFAVDLFDTRDVFNTPDVTPLPNIPLFIAGMIDLRGVITTIIDLLVMMNITRGVYRVETVTGDCSG